MELKVETQDFFFLKVWAKNVGAHYMHQNMVILQHESHTCATHTDIRADAVPLGAHEPSSMRPVCPRRPSGKDRPGF